MSRRHTDLDGVFRSLRAILQRCASHYVITDDAPTRYCLEAKPGPATLRAWGGKMKKPLIPVAWVAINQSSVSYHLMGLDGNPKLTSGLSAPLKARMQGRTCFNFTSTADALLTELEHVTAEALAGFERAGFSAEQSTS